MVTSNYFLTVLKDKMVTDNQKMSVRQCLLVEHLLFPAELTSIYSELVNNSLTV